MLACKQICTASGQQQSVEASEPHQTALFHNQASRFAAWRLIVLPQRKWRPATRQCWWRRTVATRLARAHPFTKRLWVDQTRNLLCDAEPRLGWCTRRPLWSRGARVHFLIGVRVKRRIKINKIDACIGKFFPIGKPLQIVAEIQAVQRNLGRINRIDKMTVSANAEIATGGAASTIEGNRRNYT